MPASRILRKLHNQIETYRDVELTEESNMTLGEWMDKWLDDYMALTIRESTMDSYKTMTKYYIEPHLGMRKSDPSPPARSRGVTIGSGKIDV